jgi:predicted nucleotide-binding protein (sugar kinase/HSP70/actin superfamily)
MKKRATLRIGMPRVLNMYSHAPVFTGYFASLGIQAENMVYSDYTSEQLQRKAPSAAPSTRASPPSSASRTFTTCSTWCTPRSRSTSSSSR